MVPSSQILDDVEAEMRDPDYWDSTTTEAGIPCANPAVTVGERLELEDARLISDAARKANLPMCRYLLQVSRAAACRDLGDPSLAQD